MYECPCHSGGGEPVWLYLLAALAVMKTGGWILRKRSELRMTEERKRPGAAMKALIVVALAVVAGAAMVAKNGSQGDAEPETASKQVASQTAAQESGNPSDEKATANPDSQEATTQPRPKLVDLGAGKCIPCKMMVPILEEFQEEYQGKFDAVFIDVWENKSAGEQYGIRVIPTQIFFDADGKELFRHEGFFSKEDILGKWKELGIAFSDATKTENANGN